MMDFETHRFVVRVLVRACVVVRLMGPMDHAAMAVIVSKSTEEQLVVPGELMLGLNLDGVAQVRGNDGTHCTAAAITDFHLLTAAHCFDEDADLAIDPFDAGDFQIRFELPSGDLINDISLENIVLPDDWVDRWADVAVIRLDEMIDKRIPRYPLHAGRHELQQEVTIVGYGATGRGATGGGVRMHRKIAGKNRYELLSDDLSGVPAPPGVGLVYDFDSGAIEENAIELMGFKSDLGLGVLEAMSGNGDSGGPVFIGNSIAGIVNMTGHGLIGDTHPAEGTFGELGFDTRVSTFGSFISDATVGRAQFVVLPGDFDESGTLDSADIDLLAEAILAGSDEDQFDLNYSGEVDREDSHFWLSQLAMTYRGDANLDGHFDSSDLVTVFTFGQYEDSVPSNSGWKQGDWNGDREFDAGDLVSAFQDGGYKLGSHAAVSAVPEPSCVILLVFGTIGLCRARKHP